MNVSQAISARRSIRKFHDTPVARELIEQVLQAACLAPSGKNRQPWHFTVLQGAKKDTLVDAIEAAAAQNMTELELQASGALRTTKVMREAPVCIYVHNPQFALQGEHSKADNYRMRVDTQSVGAAIQNMLLRAEELGLGTLWICNVFYAEREIAAFLGRTDMLIAAVAIGYADESPAARPRKPLSEVTTWLE